MSNGYSRSKGRNGGGQFAKFPHQCLSHENYTRLSSSAIRMLIDILYQYNGFNNGDLTAAFSILKERGWKSKETIRLALLELLHFGWIILTRRGGLNRKPNLYAITFIPVDECGGKPNVKSSRTALGNWKLQADEWTRPPRQKANG